VSVLQQYIIFDARWLMSWKGYGRKRSWPSHGTIPTNAWNDWGKRRRNSEQQVSKWRLPEYNSKILLLVLGVSDHLNALVNFILLENVFRDYFLTLWTAILGELYSVIGLLNGRSFRCFWLRERRRRCDKTPLKTQLPCSRKISGWKLLVTFETSSTASSVCIFC
jgi:hypothetical protein